MKIGFTGSRQGMTKHQRTVVLDLLYKLQPTELHHGGCVGGDVQFNNLFKMEEVLKICHPCNIPAMQGSFVCHVRKKPALPLQRNRAIVLVSDIMIAAPNGMTDYLRSGTWSTIRYAQAMRKKIYVVFPDGTIKKFGFSESGKR